MRVPAYCLLSLSLLLACEPATRPLRFEESATTRPWTYWWWMGSAVEKAEITQQLVQMRQAGMGGVHIIPIYGVKGEEGNFLPYLGPDWQKAVRHTIRTADSLGMGVDLTLGTGWPYGGPWISDKEAAKKLRLLKFDIQTTTPGRLSIDSLAGANDLHKIATIMMLSEQGDTIRWTSIHDDTSLNVGPGRWSVYLAGEDLSGQQVKRAAPGGEGAVIDYFDEAAISKYLQVHDTALASLLAEEPPRAFYHDSYEAYGADWSADFPAKFEALQAYPFSTILPALADTSHADHPRVLHDFRETLSELLYARFTRNWTEWISEKSLLSRNQAHGSPANILDLYALADIPETESFGSSGFAIPGLRVDEDYEMSRFGQPSPLMMKFASSPAHLLNKSLVSSETATWLGNHFKVALSQVKPQVDELFTAGINHIFFHGMTYSPDRAGFPGWLFYASTNFNRQSHFRDELPELNGYISRVQAYLQNTSADHDLLLYFPIHDLWTHQQPGERLLPLDVHSYENWFSATPFGALSRYLWEHGYTFDYLSDRQLAQLRHTESLGVYAGEANPYRAVILPPLTYLSLESLQHLLRLARKGTELIFMEKLPSAVPGYGVSQAVKEQFEETLVALRSEASVRVLEDFSELASLPGLRPESMKEQGLDFMRKKHPDGQLYFVSNLDKQFREGLIRLRTESVAVEIIEPLSGRRGLADSRMIDGQTQLYLQLAPGSSAILITYQEKLPDDIPVFNFVAVTDSMKLDNPWYVSFESAEDAPVQQTYKIDTLTSWTTWGDSSLRHFSGKARYVMDFTLPDEPGLVEAYRLVFDELRESARVILNGEEVGTVWSLPYQLLIPANKLQRENHLEVIVQNLSANRIAQLERQGLQWKNFYDINFVDIQYRPFDASGWAPEPSGIIGDVMLQKIQYFH